MKAQSELNTGHRFGIIKEKWKQAEIFKQLWPACKMICGPTFYDKKKKIAKVKKNVIEIFSVLQEI